MVFCYQYLTDKLGLIIWELLMSAGTDFICYLLPSHTFQSPLF